MAKVHYDIGPKMTKTQTLLGWLYLPFFALLTALGIQMLASALRWPLSEYTLNIANMSVNLVFVLLVYHRFLLKSFRGFTENFWHFIQTLILGFALYYTLQLVLTAPLILLEDTTANNKVVEGLLGDNTTVMVIFTVVVAPIVEETLVRGILFGSIHGKSRILAYVVSVLFFTAIHVWQHAGTMSIGLLLANCAAYIAPSVALGWTYEKSGTILCPILLHAVINALACGVSLSL